MRETWRLLAVALALAATGDLRAGSGVWTSNGPWGGIVTDLEIHPTVSTTLYATTNAGLYKSVDGGTSWVRADRGIPSGVFPALGVLLDRDQPDTLYVLDRANRLFRSDDAADNWAPTGYVLPAAEAGTDWKDQPGSIGTFFLATRTSSTSPTLRVRRSTDGGVTLAGAGSGLPVDRNFRSICVDPTNGLRVIAGAEFRQLASGVPSEPSLYRSIDGGATWTTVLRIDTTDYTPEAGDCSFGAGATVYAHVDIFIHRSDDDGATWTGPLADNFNVPRLFAHPTVAGTLYLGDTAGMSKSTDSGATLTPINTGFSPNATYTHASTFAPVAGDVKAIMAETGFPAPGSGLWVATSGSGLYRSIDAGSSWTATGINEGLGGVNIRALLVHPNPSTRPAPNAPGARIYAGFGDTFFSSPASYVSTNTGATWNVSNNQLRASQLRALVIDPTTAGFTAPQVSTSVLFAAGRASFAPGFRNGGLYKSTNGGTTWASFDGNLPTRTVGGFMAADIGTVRSIVLDPRSCTIPPVGACANGPLKRIFATATGFLSSISGGSVVTQTYTHRIVRSDNADTAVPTWVDISTTLPANQAKFDCSVNSDCPVTQSAIVPIGLRISPTDSNVIFISTFITDPASPGALDVPNGVLRTLDGGATWTPVSNGLPRRAGYTNIAYDVFALAMHPANPDILWATSFAPGQAPAAPIYKTTDGGASWLPSASGISAGADLRALFVDPNDANTLYASGSGDEANPGSVFRTEDGGATWRSISIGLPRDAALSLALDPFVPTVLHAGTTSGVWSIEQVPDDDGDGAPDATENNAPNGGDGNSDGMQDGTQGDVGSSVVILRPGPRSPQGAGGFFTSDIISGTPTAAGGCTQAVDVQAEIADRHGRDPAPSGFYRYPRDLVRFEILDCAQAIVDITFHGANFATQYGWTFRFFGPQTPGVTNTLGFYDFSSRATLVAASKWRLSLAANQFGSYRPAGNAILFEGGPACYDDRVFQAGFEDGSGFVPPACN